MNPMPKPMAGPPQQPPRPKPSTPVVPQRPARDYAEFLPAAVEISVQPVPHVVPVLIGLIMALVATALVWSWVAELDVYTPAAGRVRASQVPAVIQPLEPGRVTVVLVANGRRVAAGDVLMELDKVAVLTALDAAISGRASQLAEVQRRGAAYRLLARGDRSLPEPAYSPDIPQAVIRRENEALATEHQSLITLISGNAAQRSEGEAKRARFLEVKAARARLVDVLQEKVAMAQSLLATSSGSRSTLITAQEAKVRAEIDLADTAAQLAEIEAALLTLAEQERQAIATYLANQSKGVQAAERQVEQLDQEIRRQQDRLAHLTLAAPVAGTVQQLATTAAGQVVTPGQALAVIVPDGTELMVEALVPSSDIGFVRTGAEVTVKADAFPFTRYGTFAGTVAALSGEAVTIREAQGLQDPASLASGQANTPPSGVPSVTGLFFIARIHLKSPELAFGARTLKLEPGMTVRAEIKTESRRVIDYVLSPVTQVLAEAGHER